MSHLRSISIDYDKAEVTCIFLHNKTSGGKINLFTVFELIPNEQQSSLAIGDKASGYLKRESVPLLFNFCFSWSLIHAITISHFEKR
ncbi:unnamed protein product [marine sediment metagenome]|uniref:Uncharacterized protein n=1 Tax=marine sediment metagenome TaxID=412755 RepID=X1ULX5_9ZZZZ